MSKKEQILGHIVRVVNNTAPNSEVYLFGSRATGKSTKFSDWDLLILLNSTQLTFNFETAIMNEFYQLELQTGEVISPLVYTKTDWENYHQSTTLFKKIQREAIKIQ